MIDNPFREFYYERLSIHVQDEEQWEMLLDILEREEDLYAGFSRDEYRHSEYYYIFHAHDEDEIHCGYTPHTFDGGNNFIEFEDMLEYRWPHLAAEIKCSVGVDIGELF